MHLAWHYQTSIWMGRMHLVPHLSTLGYSWSQKQHNASGCYCWQLALEQCWWMGSMTLPQGS
jgi:hypothetical protein